MVVHRISESGLSCNCFENMLKDIGMSKEEVSTLSELRSDCVPMPYNDYKFEIKDSDIHGQGVFATSLINKNEIIGHVRIGLNRTPLGYKINHSDNYNAETVSLPDGGGFVRSLVDIKIGDEITIDYRHAIKESNKSEMNVIASIGVIESFSYLSILSCNGASKEDILDAIDRLEIELLKMEQSEHGLEHLFCDGLYIRHARIKSGVLFITPKYNKECVLTVLSGKILVITDCNAEIVNAPSVIKTEVGTKRVIYVIEDVYAHTVHSNPDNIQDITKLESMIYGGDK